MGMAKESSAKTPHQQHRMNGPRKGVEETKAGHKRHHRPAQELQQAKGRYNQLRRKDVSSADNQDIGKGIAPKEDDRGSSRKEDQTNRRMVRRIDRPRVASWCKERC